MPVFDLSDAGVRLQVNEHFRVDAGDAIAEGFVSDVFDGAGKPIDLYPGQDVHRETPNRLTFYWTGPKQVAVLTPFDGQGQPLDALDTERLRLRDVVWQQTGTRRGGDFRQDFFDNMLARVAKAQLAAKLGKTIGGVSNADIARLTAAEQRRFNGGVAKPFDLTARDYDAAVLALSGGRPVMRDRVAPGTSTSIDAAYTVTARELGATPTYSLVENGGSFSTYFGIYTVGGWPNASSDLGHMAMRFSLALIAGASAINDSVLRMTQNQEPINGGHPDHIRIRPYGTGGVGDPQADNGSPSTLYANCGLATAYLLNVTDYNTGTGNKDVDIGTTADGHILTAVGSPGTYALTVEDDTLPAGTQDNQPYFHGQASANSPKLIVDYTAPTATPPRFVPPRQAVQRAASR